MPKDNIDFEIKFYEGILKHKPDFIEALVALADLYTKKGLYKQGLELDQKLSVLRPHDPIILYNLACSYSLLKNIEAAFRTIQEAMECGYDNLPYIEQDADLIHLRQDERFQKYFSQWKNKSKSAK